MAAFDRDAATMRVIEELKRLYKTKILPLEQMYRFDLFNSPYLTDAEFDSKPQVSSRYKKLTIFKLPSEFFILLSTQNNSEF